MEKSWEPLLYCVVHVYVLTQQPSLCYLVRIFLLLGVYYYQAPKQISL